MLTHLRQGPPWLVMLGSAVPGSALVVVAFAFSTEGWSGAALQAGLLLLALPAAFVLDDPPAATVEATPRSPWWNLASRLLAVVGLATVLAISVAAWRSRVGVDQAWLLFALPMTLAVGLVASAAAMQRGGRSAPGDLVASGGGLVLVGMVLFGPSWRGMDMLPYAGAADVQDLAPWSLLAVTSLAVLLWAPTRPGWRSRRILGRRWSG
jgi:hypothetical protein